MTRAVVAFGSNVGDRLVHIQEALELLKAKVNILRTSHVFETSPMYVTEQPAFLNGAILLETNLGPLPLMQFLKDIEAQVGRQTRPRNGPREIDLDLLLYGDLRYRFEKAGQTVLDVPHPRMAERLFVLQPMSALDPELRSPGLGLVKALIDSTDWSPENVVERHHAELSVQRI